MGRVVNHLPPRAFKAAKIPKVRTRPRRTSAIKCRAHLNWIKNPEIWRCLISGKHECSGPLDPHHVVTRGAGGGDEQVVPLCRRAHDLCHKLKTKAFDARFGTDIAATAAELWEMSPAGRAYRRLLATASPQVGTSAEETLRDEASDTRLSASTHTPSSSPREE